VQLGGFIPDLAHMTATLRELLKKGVAFQWLEEHEDCFQGVKAALTSPMCVRFFRPQQETELLTDASSLKGARLRSDANGRRQAGAHQVRLEVPERRRESLRNAGAGGPGHQVGNRLLQALPDGRPDVHGGHRSQALVPMFKKGLGDVENARVLRYREQLTQYSFDVQWVPGKTHEIADALSRAPIFDPPGGGGRHGRDGRRARRSPLKRLIEAAPETRSTRTS
jgi:hypothetical protein